MHIVCVASSRYRGCSAETYVAAQNDVYLPHHDLLLQKALSGTKRHCGRVTGDFSAGSQITADSHKLLINFAHYEKYAAHQKNMPLSNCECDL